MQRVIAIVPHLSQVKGIEAVTRRFGRGHYLHLERPGRKLTSFNRMQQIKMVVVRVFTSEALRFLSRQALDALVRLEVVLNPECFARRVHPLERMRAEAIHVSIRSRYAAIAK